MFFTALYLITLLNSTCLKRDLFFNIVYEATVYDSIGGKPSQGLNVYFKACEYATGKNGCQLLDLGSAVTDANGHFKFDVKKAGTNKYWVFIFSNTWPQGFSIENIPEKDLITTYKILYFYK